MLLVKQEHKGQQELRELPVLREPLVLREQPLLLGLKGQLAVMVGLVPKELRVL
jgi:hypothetical protein